MILISISCCTSILVELKLVHLTLHELEWNLMVNLIKGFPPPSHAKHKYMTIVELLCNDESMSRYAHSLSVIIQLVQGQGALRLQQQSQQDLAQPLITTNLPTKRQEAA